MFRPTIGALDFLEVVIASKCCSMFALAAMFSKEHKGLFFVIRGNVDPCSRKPSVNLRAC